MAESFSFTPVGWVCNAVTEPADTGWGRVESVIRLAPKWDGAFDGIGQFSHAVVMTYLHRVREAHPEVPPRRRPRNRQDMPLIGVFAQRARVRPNPIGITACRIVRATGSELVVVGLDAINDTPVLDVKPYVPQFDRVANPIVPFWVDHLMTDFF